MNKTRILANMHLYAVLPRLEELVRLDEEAERIAREMNITIHFLVNAGPSLYLTIADGKVSSSRVKGRKSDAGLFFYSCDQFNRMFLGEKVIPLPFKGITKFKDLKKFTRLSEILTRYLKPSDADMADPAFRAKHVELTLMVGLAGAGEIAENDPKVRRIKEELRDGSILFSVLPDGPTAHVVVEHGRIGIFNGPIDDPSSTIEIRDVDLAVALLAGKVDTFAANGAGDIKASGFLPLADEFNALLDRVGLYLE